MQTSFNRWVDKPTGIFSSVQSLSRVRLFATPWTTACQASLSFTISQSLLKLMSFDSMPSNHFILCYLLFFWLQSFPASGSFPMSQFFASGGQCIGASASASIFPMNIQNWFPLGINWCINAMQCHSEVKKEQTTNMQQLRWLWDTLWKIRFKR